MGAQVVWGMGHMGNGYSVWTTVGISHMGNGAIGYRGYGVQGYGQ